MGDIPECFISSNASTKSVLTVPFDGRFQSFKMLEAFHIGLQLGVVVPNDLLVVIHLGNCHRRVHIEADETCN